MTFSYRAVERQEEAMADHDKNFEALLQKAGDAKLKWKQPGVP